MAYAPRSIDAIFQELLIEKQELNSLNGLVSGGITDENSLIQALETSKVAEWILWCYNMATQIHLTEVRTLTAIEDIDEIFEIKRVATDGWYIEKALEFQVDDDLIIDPITYQVRYETIDEVSQIIGSCTTKAVSNQLFLKVRRKDTNILTTDEKTQFENYMDTLKIAGTQIIVENFEGDEFTLNMTIIYDGTKNVIDVQSQVEATINDYLNNLEFDSKFITSALIDRLQALDVLIDPRFDSGSVIDSLGNDVAFVHEYTTNAGWGRINTLTPLSATITYIPRKK